MGFKPPNICVLLSLVTHPILLENINFQFIESNTNLKQIDKPDIYLNDIFTEYTE